MKTFTLLATALVLTAPAWAQIITSPVRNATAVSHIATVTATLPSNAATATIHVFSNQAEGRKFGTISHNGNNLTFSPANSFRAGETLQATLTTSIGAPQVWQFTAAAASSSGTFNTLSSVPLGVANRYAPSKGGVLGDFDGDGDLDLAAMLDVVSGTNIALRFNDGSGAFSIPTVVPAEISAGNGPIGIATGDVNGDGHLDLILACYNGIYVLINSGAAQFAVQPLMRLSLDGFSIIKPHLADVDGDGDLDLMVPGGNTGTPTATIGNVLSCLNNGRGLFAAPRTITVPIQSSDIALGDIDSDGDLDLVSASFSTALSIRFNDGQGNFSGGADFTTDQVTKVAFADADSDGDLDLFVCGRSPNGVFLWSNNGAGNFGSVGGTQIAWGCRPWSIEMADIDGDGNDDLLASDDVGVSKFHVVRRYGAIFADTPLNLTHECMYMAAGDIDNDGDVDFVAIDTYGRMGYPVAYSYFNDTRRPLATKPVATSASLRLWPNPVGAAMLHIELPAATHQGQIFLCTALGQLIMQQKFSGAQVDINTAAVAPGLYLLTVQAEGQAPLTRRVVVE